MLTTNRIPPPPRLHHARRRGHRHDSRVHLAPLRQRPRRPDGYAGAVPSAAEGRLLKGIFVGVNWDVEEMELHKDVIVDKKLLQTSWLPVLPIGCGEGLSA